MLVVSHFVLGTNQVSLNFIVVLKYSKVEII